MDIQDSVNLSWIDFQTNLSAFVSALHNDEAFSDVTLVTEDNYQVKSNKLVLCASSLFFRKILTDNPHQQPLIYLKGIAAKDLESIMAFIFNGEVRIKQDCVSSFMSASEDLQIKGFSEELVKLNESIINIQETNIEVIEQENKDGEDHILVTSPNNVNEIKFDNSPDLDLGWCKYFAFISQFGVRYARCNLCKQVMPVEKTFLAKHWTKYHSDYVLPLSLERLKVNEESYTVSNTDGVHESNSDKNNLELERNPEIVELEQNIPKSIKHSDGHVQTEHLNRDDDNDDDELAELPEFWEAGGLCNESLRQKLKSEKFNKCLVCDKLIGTNSKQLLKHWKFYHLEEEVEHSVSLREGVERKKKKKGEVPSMLKYQCYACSCHPRGCDIPKHYSVKTNWEVLARMRSTAGGALEEGADPHTLYMFEKGYTRKFGPTWRSHQRWKGEGK